MEKTKNFRVTFREFLIQRGTPNSSEERVLAFADYFLAFFDTFAQLSAETGVPEADIEIILINKLETIDKIKFQEVDIKKKRGQIIEAADYIILNRASTRQAAARFGCTNVTIHSWMTTKLQEIDAHRYNQVLAVMHQNKPKTIEDEGITERINSAVELVLAGYTIEQIAARLSNSDMKLTPAMIYRDLEKRLVKLDPNKSQIVSEILEKHSLENLRNQPKSR